MHVGKELDYELCFITFACACLEYGGYGVTAFTPRSQMLRDTPGFLSVSVARHIGERGQAGAVLNTVM